MRIGAVMKPFVCKSVDLDELHVELEIGVRWDGTPSTPGSIAKLGRDMQDGALTEAKLGDTLIPSLDHLSNTELELEWLASIPRRVKLRTIGGEGPRVVHGAHVTDGREGLAITWAERLDSESGCALDSYDLNIKDEGLACKLVISVDESLPILDLDNRGCHATLHLELGTNSGVFWQPSQSEDVKMRSWCV